ncbi:hypothetical protein C0J52_12560 [Blattella germanica]|nr:hypothetical protein C0J52_12560 [Blattella germanica]
MENMDEMKVEVMNYIELKPKYRDAVSKDDDEKKLITLTNDEICHMKWETEEMDEMEQKDEDVSVDEKPIVLKNEHQMSKLIPVLSRESEILDTFKLIAFMISQSVREFPHCCTDLEERFKFIW